MRRRRVLDEHEELLRLRKENRILRQERDILSKNVLVCGGRTVPGGLVCCVLDERSP